MRFQRTKPAPKSKEGPKARDVARARQEVAPENRVRRFWRETTAELKKVVWPSRDQAINLTLIVVAVVLAMSAFLGTIDYILTQVVRIILTR